MSEVVEFRVYPPAFPEPSTAKTERASDRSGWFRVRLEPNLKALRAFSCKGCIDSRPIKGAVGLCHGHDCEMRRDHFGRVTSAPRGEIGVLVFSRTLVSFPLIVHECSHATWALFERAMDTISFESPSRNEVDERWAQTTEWLFTQVARRFVELGLYPS